MDNCNLKNYQASSGSVIPVWTLEIQTVIQDVDKILDAVMQVHPLSYGKYQRTARISAVGMETAQPESGSTTSIHVDGFTPGQVETYPMVELKISIERNNKALEKVMDAIHYVHHYEEPAILLQENWASRANYDPNRDNPNRFWNSGRGLPDRIKDICK